MTLEYLSFISCLPEGSRRQRRPEQQYPLKISRDSALKPSFDATNVYQQCSHITTHQGKHLVIASQASESRRLGDPSIGFSVSKVWKFHGIFCEDCCDDGTLERSLLHQTSSSLSFLGQWSEPFFSMCAASLCVKRFLKPEIQMAQVWCDFEMYTATDLKQETVQRRGKNSLLSRCQPVIVLGREAKHQIPTVTAVERGSHHSYASTRS